MKSKPLIIVQLVHIDGPLKGEIQEFSDPEITIGRHPSCLMQLPKDQTLVSRKHASIHREGNLFKLIDHSTNGTFVNGKRIREVYLKEGDVLSIAERGPKVSFLTKMADIGREVDGALSQSRPGGLDRLSNIETPSYRGADEPSLNGRSKSPKMQMPLSIQFGPTLRSFRELPMTIGKNPACDFVLDHPSILDRHAEIFFTQDQYWVRNLTGRQMIAIDGKPVQSQAPLNHNNSLALSPQGPKFRFLSGGRLAEIEEA